MLAECELSVEGFCPAKDFLQTRSAKAALNAATDVRLSQEGAKAAKVVAGWVLERVATDLLWFSPDGVMLYYCSGPSLLNCLGSLKKDETFFGTHFMRPVHYCSETYRSRMQNVDVGQLTKANAYFCKVKTALSNI